MEKTLIISMAVASQLAFTAAALLYRFQHVNDARLLDWWFVGVVLLEIVGTVGMFAVLSKAQVGWAFSIMSAFGILISTAVGFALIGDIPSNKQLIGTGLSMLAILVMI